MALSNTERQRRYREKHKDNPDYIEYKRKKNKEAYRKYSQNPENKEIIRERSRRCYILKKERIAKAERYLRDNGNNLEAFTKSELNIIGRHI